MVTTSELISPVAAVNLYANTGNEYYIDDVEWGALTDDACRSASRTEAVVTVEDCSNINELSFRDLTIYPNPNNGQFTITNSQEMTEVIITDLQGKVIYNNNNINLNKVNVELNDLERGMYMINIKTVDGRITNIELLTTGSNYNNITATVIDPLFDFEPDEVNSVDVRAKLRPILSPEGYHGFNLINEMHCRRILLYAYITETDNNKIGKSNSYSAIGILKNPIFSPDPETANTASPDTFDNRIAITTDDYAKLNANSVITQIDVNNDVVFTAQIHEIDSTSNTVFLAEYIGPYRNNKVIGNGDTSFDPSLTITSNNGQRITINNPIEDNVVYSDYIQRTGEVYFMEDFFPLSRTDLSREEFKFVLEF